jgi:hypothetical protein
MERAILKSKVNKVDLKAGDPEDDGIYDATIMSKRLKEQAYAATRDLPGTSTVEINHIFDGMKDVAPITRVKGFKPQSPEVIKLPPVEKSIMLG